MNYTFGDEFIADREQNNTIFNADTKRIYVEPVIQQLFINNTHGEWDVLKKKWKAYRQDILSDEHILGLMQENMEYMEKTGAFKRDCARWAIQNNDGDLTQIMNYVKERMAYLDEYYK